MRSVALAVLLPVLALCTLWVNAGDEPQTIAPEGLATSQTLPSLDGAVADPSLSAAVPDDLILNDAVSRVAS